MNITKLVQISEKEYNELVQDRELCLKLQNKELSYYEEKWNKYSEYFKKEIKDNLLKELVDEQIKKLSFLERVFYK